jgi:3-oxoacyl-[acyl-carrier protein] reductase
VALSGTRIAALEDTAKEIGGSGHPILPCNLSDLDAVDRLVPQAEEALGGIDILVNNAGMTRDNLFMRMKNEEWDEVLTVNLTASFHLTRAVLRGMMKQRFGRIINISSVVGVVGNPGQGNYAASKAGIIGMGKALAHEVASRNITVNAIAPGFIGSAMTEALNDKQREAILAGIPAGRLGTAAEVAACAVFLASEAAGYVTGHTLNVNGGMVML